jgi:O-antigen/teichoic acid export membrane protein
MLAVFVDDAAIGIYSFAAMFIEGLYQVPVVVRTVVNPVLVRLISDGDRAALGRFGRRIMALSLVTFVAAAGSVHLVFPYLAPWFPEGLVSSAALVLLPLTIGLGFYAAFVPLDFILMQAGQPGRQSALMTVNILINVGLNIWLIPIYGIQGAAMATACAFAVSGLTLNAAVWRWLPMPGGLLFGGR